MLAAVATAQSRDVLALERLEDRPARDRLLRRLAEIRLARVSLEDATLREVARYLTAAAGRATSFVVAAAGELPRVTLQLRHVPLTRLLAVLRRAAGVRFAFFAGMVKIVPPEELRQATTLRVYDLRAAVASVPSYKAPKPGLSRREAWAETEEETDNSTASGFTLERIAEVVRTHAVPDSWDREGVSLAAAGGLLLVRQTESGHRAVARVLAALGVISAPRPRAAASKRHRFRGRRR